MIASVHIADIGARSTLAVQRKRPRPNDIAGLRSASVAIAAPLSGSFLARPDFGRAVLITFWDDDDAADRFEAEHPLAAKFAGGWRIRGEPLRAFGSWPGLPDDVERSRATDYDGPALVVTLGRLRLTQAVRFLRTSSSAGAAALVAPGMVWGTAMARPPFVATCSLWESTRALSTYAFGQRPPAHLNAINTDRAKPFHHQSAFIRFRPYRVEGRLSGRNPMEFDSVGFGGDRTG